MTTLSESKDKKGNHTVIERRLFESPSRLKPLKRLPRFLFTVVSVSLLVSFLPAVALGAVLVNEVAPAESSSADWIEIYNTGPGTQSIENWEMLERSSSLKTFPAYTMAADEFIVLHINDGVTPDETGADTNGNGYRDFYSADSGLTGSDNVIILKNDSAVIQDAISFANGDASWAAAQQTAFDEVVNASQWTGTAGAGVPTNDTESVGSSGLGAGESLQRAAGGTDTNAKADWSLMSGQSPGAATASALDPAAVIVINEVQFKNSPDWIELYCQAGGSDIDIQGCSFRYKNTGNIIKSIAAGTTISTGEYIVLIDEEGTDETTAGADGVLMLFAGEGLTSTDAMVMFYDPIGTVEDVVAWADLSGSFGSSLDDADLDVFCDAGEWTKAGGTVAESDCVNAKSFPSNYSIGRDEKSTDTAHSAAEWHWISAPTQGAVNPEPAALTSFTVTAPSYAVSGSAFDITISAKDQSGETLVSYAGIVNLTSSNGSVSIAPADSTGNDFTSGELTLSVTLTGAGNQTTIQVADSGGGESGTSGTINVVTVLPAPVFRINEVAFNGGGGGFTEDWVEIYCVDDGVSGSGFNLSGYTIRASNETGINKTIGDCTVKTGEYLILHYVDGTDETQLTGDAVDIYTDKSGPSGTDDVIVLYDSSEAVLDMIVWANQSGSFSNLNETYLDGLCTAGHWTRAGGAVVESDCVDSSTIGNDESTARDASSTDTGAKADWVRYVNPTPGTASATALSATIKVTEVMVAGSADWVEFYCVDDNNSGNGVNLKNCSITDLDSTNTTHKKVLGDSDNDGVADQDCTIKTGEFLILYYDQAGTDETAATGGSLDNTVEIFTEAQSSVTSTDEQQVFVDALGNYIDGVCWSNQDGTFTTEQTQVDLLVPSGNWTIAGGSAAESDCIDSTTVSSSQSIARDNLNTDTNAKADWMVLDSPNPGALTPAPVTARLMINEVLVKNKTGDKDWVEIYCVDDGNNGNGVNIKGAYISNLDGSGTSKNKIFGDSTNDGSPNQDCTIKTGEFLVFTTDTADTDETEAGGDGILNISSDAWTSITSTDETLAIYDAVGNLLDCVAFSDGALPSAELGNVQTLLDSADAYTPANKAWTDFEPTDADPNDCFLSTTMKTGWSMARDSVPTDNNSKEDWTPRSTSTPGANNGDPPTVHHFDVDSPAYAVSGTAFDITATARNEDNTLMDTYVGTIVISSSSGSVSVAPESASGFTDGVLTVPVTLTGATGQTTTIQIEDSGNTGTSQSIQIVDQIPEPVLKINEVAFDGGGGGFDSDWIEIYCQDDGLSGNGFNLAGYTIKPKNETTIDKTFGNTTIKTGEYLLLQYNNSSGTDESALTGDFIDCYTADTGLTSSDEMVAIYTPAGDVVDMVVWANQNGSFTNLSEEYLKTLVTAGHWTKAGAEVAESDCLDSTVVGGGESVARITNEETSIPDDTASKADWLVTAVPTPGKSNLSGPKPNVGLLISEIAPSKGGGGQANDWIEVYCYDDLNGGAGVEISGYSFYIDSTVKSITNGTIVRTGEFILLVFDTEDTDDTESDDGVINIFSDRSGMVTSDDQVVIYDHKDNLIDAVCYANMDGDALTETEAADMTTIIAAGGWVGSADEESCASVAGLGEGNSLARDRLFTDTNAAADWQMVTSPTPGKKNYAPGEPYALEITPSGTVSAFVSVSVDIGVQVVDIFGSIVTSSSVQIDVNTDSVSAEVSMDGGFTWSSSGTGYATYGSLSAQARDSNSGRFVVSATTPGGSLKSDAKEIVVISLPSVVLNEIMYNPVGDSGLEYIELYNRSASSVDLTGWNLTIADKAISIPDSTTIAVGEHLLLAKELDTFESVYGDGNGTWGDHPTENFQAVDVPTFTLDNTSGTISLNSSDTVTKTSVTYLDSWGADANGLSLEKKDPDMLDKNDPVIDAYNWAESEPHAQNGTPGHQNSLYEGNPSTLEFSHTIVSTAYIGDPLIIRAKILSNRTIDFVRLYYREALSGDSYTTLNMNLLAGTNLYEVRIPQEDVTLSGIEYYLQASDIVNTKTLPALTPSDIPYTIAIEDNTMKMMVVPRKKGVSEGEYFYVDIMIVNARDLVGAGFEITYDTTYLDLQDSDENREGEQIAVGSLMGLGFNEINLAEKGLIQFSVTGVKDEVTGDGPLAVIYFKVKNPNAGVPLPSGTYPLSLQNCLVIDDDDNETVPAQFDGEVVIGTGSSEIIDDQGGVVSGPQGTQIQIAAGVIKGSFRITIEQMDANDLPTTDSLVDNQYMVPSMVALDIKPHTLTFTRPVTLVFGFDDDLIEAAGIEEKNLAIYHWHQDLSSPVAPGGTVRPKWARRRRSRLRSLKRERKVGFFSKRGGGSVGAKNASDDAYWEKIGGDVASGDNTVTAMITRPGIYMLVGDTDPGRRMEIYDVSVSPSPFSPAEGSLKPESYLTFGITNDADELWVRVYDVKGRLVRTLAEKATNVPEGLVQYTWNGIDDHGQVVPTGIYVMSIYAEDELYRLAKAETSVIVSRHMYE